MASSQEKISNGQPCDAPGCEAPSFSYVYRFKNRILISEEHFCRTHLQELTPKPVQSKPLLESIPQGKALVDLDTLYCPLNERSHILCFRTIDNFDAKMNIWIGQRRAAEIRVFMEFKKTDSSMYEVFSNTVDSMGGSLDSVTVDRSEDQYSTTLQLSTPAMSVEFPKASDAIMLALAAELPIYATESALRKANTPN